MNQSLAGAVLDAAHKWIKEFEGTGEEAATEWIAMVNMLDMIEFELIGGFEDDLD